ncbi:hypothetical protein [Microtetraspora malaysiensis]|uniref:hypothetical protein n=1 Tax=Microtetraspora malaysiensis TaxID=161358 RepID=UPI003D8DE8DD
MADYGYTLNCLVGEVRKLREELADTREGLADIAKAVRELTSAVQDLRTQPQPRRWFSRRVEGGR